MLTLRLVFEIFNVKWLSDKRKLPKLSVFCYVFFVEYIAGQDRQARLLQ